MEEFIRQPKQSRRVQKPGSHQMKNENRNWYIHMTFLALGLFMIIRAIQVIVDILDRIVPN